MFLFALVLAAGLTACRGPRAPEPVKVMGPGPELLLRRLASAIWGRQGPELAKLFTVRCREGCSGYVPSPMTTVGSYRLARWIPDPRGRGLLITLAYLSQSHGAIRHVELSPVEARILPRQVLLRARLQVEGDVRKGDRRVDQGVVDLVLVKQQGVWRVDGFRPARLHSIWREDPGFEAKFSTEAPTKRPTGPWDEVASLDYTLPGRVTLPPTTALDADGLGTTQVVWGGRKVHLVAPGVPADNARPLLTPEGGAPVRALVAGDVDGDGRADLFVGTYGGVSGLWLNRPGGFVLMPGSRISGHVTGAVLADLDGDGDLDLFVARHGPKKRWPWQPGEPNLLLVKTPSGYKQVKTGAAGKGWSLATCGADLDDDGDVDIFVANELGPARLWLNQGKGRFVDAAGRIGLKTELVTTCAVGDADGDGRLDLLVGGRGARQRYLLGRPGTGAPGSLLPSDRRQGRVRAMMAGATLWLNRPARGGLRLVKQALPGDQWTHRAAMMDHDLDGRLDLLLLDGGPSLPVRHRWWWEALGPMLGRRSPAPLFGPERSGPVKLLIQARAGLWLDAAPLSLLDPRRRGTMRGHASVTVPASAGRVLLLAGGPHPLGLVRTAWRGGALHADEHAVLLRLRAGAANRDAIGAKVILSTGGRSQVRVSGLAPGISGPPGHVHFGVGAALRAERVEVRWPDGKVERHHDLPVDRWVVLERGKQPRWEEPEDGEPEDGEPEDGGEPEDPGQRGARNAERGTVGTLATPMKLTVQTPGGDRKLSTLAGKRATLVLFTAAAVDQDGCRKLQALSRHKGVRLLEVRLGPASRGCLNASHEATAKTAAALEDQKGLLPLLAVVDGTGKVHKLLAGALDSVRVEAALLDVLN